MSQPALSPTGTLLPASAEARRILEALQCEDASEAARRLSAWQPEAPLDRAWRLTLSGEIALLRKELMAAAVRLCQAFTQARILAADPMEQDVATADRLAARALLQLGRAYRRQDRVDDARRAHRAAYEGIRRFGSAEESWLIQRELALDARIAHDFEAAIEHIDQALAFVSQCVEPASQKRAVCLTEWVYIRLGQERWEQAVAKAREAMIAWEEHDRSSDGVPRAEALLGTTHLRRGQSLIEKDRQRAGSALDAAIQTMMHAREALEAFGADQDPDIALCNEQIDFAQRLRASLELGSLQE
ncbi:MAG: tetratricopeptide repeat protein [Phycisphaerae bacterium]